MVEEFAYHRSISPTLGVLLALALVETMVLHIVAMALWGWHVAVILGLIDLAGVLALVQLLRAIRRHPVTIGDGVLTMRLAQLRTIAIPLNRVKGLRGNWSAQSLKARDTLNLALATYPNVVVEIDPPIVLRRRSIAAVAHKIDAPRDFASALNRHMGAR